MCFAPQLRALLQQLNFRSALAALADPPEPENIGKHSVSRLFFGPFAHFDFLSTRSLLWLFLFSDSSHHRSCVCPYVGSLTSKFPSIHGLPLHNGLVGHVAGNLPARFSRSQSVACRSGTLARCATGCGLEWMVQALGPCRQGVAVEPMQHWRTMWRLRHT